MFPVKTFKLTHSVSLTLTNVFVLVFLCCLSLIIGDTNYKKKVAVCHHSRAGQNSRHDFPETGLKLNSTCIE